MRTGPLEALVSFTGMRPQPKSPDTPAEQRIPCLPGCYATCDRCGGMLFPPPSVSRAKMREMLASVRNVLGEQAIPKGIDAVLTCGCCKAAERRLVQAQAEALGFSPAEAEAAAREVTS